MPDDWHYAIDADEVEEKDVMPAVVEGREIAIYSVEGAFYDSVDHCTHGDAALSEGIVIDDVIECPSAPGRFCVKDGRALSPPVSEPIATFPTKVEGREGLRSALTVSPRCVRGGRAAADRAGRRCAGFPSARSGRLRSLPACHLRTASVVSILTAGH